MGRFWHQRATRDRVWLIWCAAGLFALVSSMAAVAYWQHLHLRAVESALSAMAQERAAPGTGDDAKTAVLVRSAPWWHAVARRASSEPTTPSLVAAQVTAAIAQNTLRLSRLELGPQPQATGAPYRTTPMSLQVEGPYPEIKVWLAELLARHPGRLAVMSIELRRVADDSTSPVQAQIQLLAFDSSHAGGR